MPNASEEALKLLEKMFMYDPSKRPSADDLLKDPYFSGLAEKYKKEEEKLKN